MLQRQLRVDIDDAQSGMRLAQPVPDGHGGTLLPAGTVITDDQLRSLGRRGIEWLTIINEAISEAELAHERERVNARLEHLNRGTNQSEATIALLKLLKFYRLSALE